MSSQTTPRGSLDAESEMLPQDPPPFVIRWTAWLLLAFLAFALIVAIVLKLPETVHCPFVLVAATGSDPIQSPHAAVLDRVSVSEGQEVKKDAELFVLRSDEIRGLDTQFRTLSQDLRTKEEGLRQADSAAESQLQIKKEEIEQAKSEVGFRENHARTSRDLVNRMEKLAKQGGEAEVDLVKLRLDLAASEKDLSVAQRTLQQTTLDLKRMETERARQHSELESEIQNLKTRIAALKNDLFNAHDNLLTIRSPYDGIVISLEQRTPGGFVQQGQILCQLSPEQGAPRARLTIGEAGLAHLIVSQRVRFFFEAYPYQRYGAVSGKLDWISPSTVHEKDGGAYFVALASLDRAYIPQGRTKRLPLRVGMKGDAHVVIGGRTLIEYAFEPIRQLRESVRQ